MLPAVLSSDLCSLISGVDRFVYPTHTDGIDYNGMGWSVCTLKGCSDTVDGLRSDR